MLKKAIALLMLVSLVACQTSIPPEALDLSPETLQMRQIQTRYFDTKDEAAVTSCVCCALLQDMGFNIDESETKLGYMLGTKDRDATNAGQIVTAVLLAALTGAVMPVDKAQKMRACIVTHPYGETKRENCCAGNIPADCMEYARAGYDQRMSCGARNVPGVF